METFRADMLETQADMLEKLKKERRDSMEDFKKVFQKELAADIKADLMVEFEAKMASEARLRREAEAGMTEEILTLRHQLAMDKAKSAQLCQVRSCWHSNLQDSHCFCMRMLIFKRPSILTFIHSSLHLTSSVTDTVSVSCE